MPNYSKKSLKGNVMTVCGPINPKDLGRVICHEHLLIDFRVVLNEPPNKKDIHYMKEKINLSNNYPFMEPEAKFLTKIYDY